MGDAVPALPALQNGWLGRLTGIRDLPSEPRATCGDCVMCAGEKESGSRVAFSPDAKCCTYVPTLANFLAGRGLGGAGRASVEARIRARAGITPLGVGLDRAGARLVAGVQSQFGQSADLLCPHYQVDTGGCGIWATRNAVCSTWSCKYDRGAAGQHFWHAVRDLLTAAEERLAYWCLLDADLPAEQLDAVLEHRAGVRDAVLVAAAPSPAEELLEIEDDEARYALIWGRWLGREEEWFLRCAGRAEQIAPDEFTALMDGVRHLADAVTGSLAALARGELPARLSFAPHEVSQAGVDVLRLVGYSAFDPLLVPASFLDPLRLFDGRATPQVLQEMAAAHGLTFGADLLGRLYDFGILVPAE